MKTAAPALSPPVAVSELRLLRHSLIAVWWITVAATLIEWNGQSTALLVQAGLSSPMWMAVWIGGGVALDAVLALALMFARLPQHMRLVYALTGLSVLIFTAAATALLPALWLHPLGPLSKNLPILAILFLLWRRA